MIRLANSGDVKEIVKYLEEVHESNVSYMSNLPFDAKTAEKSVRHVIAHPHQCAWVVDRGKGIEGILMAVAWQQWWSKKREATDLVFHVKPSAKGNGAMLYRMMMSWAKRKAHAVNITATSTMREPDPRLDEMLLKLGFKRIANYYLLEIEDERSD